MIFSNFYGNSVIVHILFFGALLIVIGDIFATLFTIFYQRYWYDHIIRPKYNQKFYPRCSIIIPCKGIPKDLGKNLQGFLELDYPSYEIVYVTESENDAAVPVIKEIISTAKNAKLAIAGHTKTCSQKNYNLLEAIKHAENPEVYVFADSDIRPEKHWLRELILPLDNSKVYATSGFRWLHATKGTIGELTHSYVNVFMYVMFVTSCYFGGVGLWGGSMAIRKKEFDSLGVADRWSRAGVDDMSLSQVIYKSAGKAVVVPHCIIDTDDLIPTVKNSVFWFERQIMYLKAHFKKTWLFLALPLAVIATMLLFALPFALIASVSKSHTFFGSGGGPGLIFYIGEICAVMLYPFLGKMHRFPKFLIIQPFLRLTHVVSYFRTFLTNRITWSGIKYKIKFNGEVAEVERLVK